MKRIIFVLSVLAASVAFLAACGDDNNSYWDAIKWQGYNDDASPVVNAGPEGGTFNFHCTNYNYVLLVSVKEKVKRVLTEYTVLSDSTWSYNYCSTDWADVHVSGPDVQVVVKPYANDSTITRSTGKTLNDTTARTLTIGVQYGNVFDEIKIIQTSKAQ